MKKFAKEREKEKIINMFWRYIKTLGIVFFAFQIANAQKIQNTGCSQILEQAFLDYDQGKLEILTDRDKINNFHACLENGNFSKEEEIRARKLLTKSYLFANKKKEAEEAMIALLTVDKEHLLDPNDPAELYTFYSQFRSKPIYRLAVRLGLNKSIPKVIQSFSTSQEERGKRYNEQIGNANFGINLFFEILLEKQFGKKFFMAFGPQFRVMDYDVQEEIISQVINYVAKNRSHWLRFPLLFKYDIDLKKRGSIRNRFQTVPYLFIGPSFDLVLRSRYAKAARTGGISYTLNNTQSSLLERDQTNTTNVSLVFGGGIKMRFKNVHFITFEFRYDNLLLNYIKPKNRFKNEYVEQDVGYVEDDLAIDAISVSVGLNLSIYNPKLKDRDKWKKEMRKKNSQFN